MKKILLGMIIGVAITSAVYYFININDEKENTAALLELLKQEQAKNKQTNETLNDPTYTMDIKSSLTIILSANDEFYYYGDKDCNKLEKSNFTFVSEILETEKKRTKNDNLMIIIKTSPGASFKNSIDLLDAITKAAIPPGHFAEMDLSANEKNCITNYKKN